MTKNIGRNYPRRDAYDKVTGKGIFTTDVSLPHMLYAKVLRSPIAHGDIVSIDTSKAEALEGVKVVASYKNTTDKIFNTSATMAFTVPGVEPVLDQRIFTDRVRYIGDEIAAVAAISPEIASRALELIEVEFRELPIVLDPLEAMEEDAPIIHEVRGEVKNSPGEDSILKMGDAEKAYGEGEVRVDVEIKLPIQKPAQLETHTAVADYRKTGELKVWSTTQTVHPTKQILAYLFDMPESKIQVINPPYVGGGFGVRIGCSAKAEPIAAVLSKMAGRPVKCEYTREEDFTASDSRHSGYVYCKLASDREGNFTALDLRAILNTGAYCSFGIETPGVLGAVCLSTYRIPNVYYRGYSVYTNILPAGAMRGFGSPQGTIAVEAAVDKMAEKLGMDPIELRHKNIMEVGDKWVLPYECSSTELHECIDRAKASIKWDEKRGRAKEQSGPIRRGVGLGIGTHVSNSAPFCVDYDSVYLRLEADGSLHMAAGAPEIGTGTTTSLPQMAAEAVGIPYDRTYMVFGDTDATPFDIGAHASRTLYAVGIAILSAAEKLREDLFKYIGEVWDLDWKKLDLVNGKILGFEGELTIEEVAAHAHLHRKRFMAIGQTTPPNTPPWHAHAAEVEVDIETGMVKVIKLAAAHDVGVAIHPQVVEGQIEGGAMMGIGYATREEISIGEDGRAYNSGYHRYMLPAFGDTPEIDCIIVESKDPTGPFGAKGVGECGMVPTAPAILSAVEDAIGIRFNEIPLTPGRVLKAIKEAGIR